MKVKALGMLLLSGNQAKTTLTLEKKEMQLCPDCALAVLRHHSLPLLHQTKC